MIKTKAELKEYIIADRNRYHLRKPRILGAILSDESYYVTKFLYCLRHLEYYSVNRKSLIQKIKYCYWFIYHRKLEKELGIRIAPNTVGKGLYIPHFSGGIIINAESLGENCIVNSGVIIGNKNKASHRPIIGSNVEITIGAKVIGKITLGDNVIVGPNSVVIKDIPANTVVSGIPAKSIK